MKSKETNWLYIKMVCRRMYGVQKNRLASEARITALERAGEIVKGQAKKDFNIARTIEKQVEKEYERVLNRCIRHIPIVQDWLFRVKGIGPRLAGLLVANIAPISRFANTSKLWAYAGLHVIDGKAPRKEKGKKANWNMELKVTAYKIGESFLKSKSKYTPIYQAYKDRIVDREVAKGSVIWGTSQDVNGKFTKKEVAFCQGHLDSSYIPVPEGMPEWTLGRIDRMGKRYIAKIFLCHLWMVWREMEGLPVTEPWIIGRTDDTGKRHTTMIGPWEMVEPMKGVA